MEQFIEFDQIGLCLTFQTTLYHKEYHNSALFFFTLKQKPLYLLDKVNKRKIINYFICSIHITNVTMNLQYLFMKINLIFSCFQ